MAQDSIVLYPELRERYGIVFKRVTLRRMQRRGVFPKQVKLTGNRVAWRRSEIEAWLANLQVSSSVQRAGE